jgi:DnaJ-class molecular chaperone
MEQKDYYQILGVGRDASAKEIKDAYRELAFKFHPDRNKEDPGQAETMKAVNEAYAVLSNAEKRRDYDRLRDAYGSSAYNQFRKSYTEKDIFSGSDILGIFEELTRSFGLRGYDEIFREFYGPGYQKFEFRKPGLFVKGYVFSGRLGEERENVLQFPFLKNIGRLPRYFLQKLIGSELPTDGTDIEDVIELSAEQAQQGGPYAYYHRKKSKKLVVRIPSGVREGQRIRLRSMGEDGKSGGKAGDLYLKVHIKKPLLQKAKDFLSDLWK